jgi:hypothetical protein
MTKTIILTIKDQKIELTPEELVALEKQLDLINRMIELPRLYPSNPLMTWCIKVKE